MSIIYILQAFFLNIWYAIKQLFKGNAMPAEDYIDTLEFVLDISGTQVKALEIKLKRYEERLGRDISTAPYENPPLWKEPQ